ncbi:conjugal transfer pilus assembly protein TraW [Pseudorhodoferax soli]|uniref:Conjugal transfer pilus assembly protein TraW n=2 Tax=Pseudorhodoferax soli TaxID=545864 RepID=A0A368XF19_9BURK|nr:conjugal transfer pilus assembly protein TraW [Pseudorhodoferax soli]
MRTGLPARSPWRLVLLMALPCAGADLGVVGPTYPIAEPHLLQMIEGRLRQKQQSGELARLEQLSRTKGERAVREPAAVDGVRTTTAPRSFHVDPGIELTQNILGPSGELLYPAGTRANPLDVVALSRQLLFFDGRDPRQVLQAHQLIVQSPDGYKPILTGGSYLDLMQRWQVPVYYDQLGLLTRRLGIAQVPALVSQDGRRLRIDELEVLP